MSDIKRIEPSERQKTCRHAFPYMGKNFDKTYCRHKMNTDNESDSIVTNEECEQCKRFKSKYIQYPLTINDIVIEKIENHGLHTIGTPVRIRPCAKEYKNKTYLGIYIGELPIQSTVRHNETENKLIIGTMNNPAIYVFELKKIIYGCESYWQPIEKSENLKDISDETIENQWYVKALKATL